MDIGQSITAVETKKQSMRNLWENEEIKERGEEKKEGRKGDNGRRVKRNGGLEAGRKKKIKLQ